MVICPCPATSYTDHCFRMPSWGVSPGSMYTICLLSTYFTRLSLGCGRRCSPTSFVSFPHIPPAASVNLTEGAHSNSNCQECSLIFNSIHACIPLRYRLIAPFGKDTIRRFANNASQMKKLAGYHFEDLLQVRQTMLPILLNGYRQPTVCTSSN